MRTTTKRTLTAGLTLALALAVGGVATAFAANPPRQRADGPEGRHSSDTALASGFGALDRSNKWQLTSKLTLNFPTFHTEGIAFAGDRIFLSAVQIIEPTVIDYQDCQYVPDSKMICGGVTNLPQTPTAGAGATYELGGMALIDLRSHNVLREVPFQQWSAAGHVATRNPFKLAASGNQLTMWAAPDNGEEGNGTEILTYQTTVIPATK